MVYLIKCTLECSQYTGYFQYRLHLPGPTILRGDVPIETCTNSERTTRFQEIDFDEAVPGYIRVKAVGQIGQQLLLRLPDQQTFLAGEPLLRTMGVRL